MIVKVGKDGRVNIPQEVSKAVEWLALHKSKSQKGWLFIKSFGRHRLYSDAEVSGSPELVELREEVAQIGIQTKRGTLEFEEPERIVFPWRFREVDLSWSEKNGWRLQLPSFITDLWRIERGNGHVGVLISDGYVEVWSMETVEAAFSVPVTETD